MALIDFLYVASSILQPMTPPDVTFITHNPAYIDPGTGSLIIQILIGLLVGGVIGVKAFWRRITSFFGRLFHRSSDVEKPDA